MNLKKRFFIAITMISVFLIEKLLLNDIGFKYVGDVLCEPGSYPTQYSCDSCLKKDGNYCPDGKTYFCCPYGTEPKSSHAKTKDDCVPCSDGYETVYGYGKAGCGTCQKVDYCWRYPSADGNKYAITNISPGTGWIKVGKAKDLKCDEESFCYKNGNNYIWGKYREIAGYEKISGVGNKNDCKEPEKYCWRRFDTDGNKYQISNMSPGNDWFILGKDDNVRCYEEDRCYLNNNRYVWGKYSDRGDYTFINEIIDVNNCNKKNEMNETQISSFSKMKNEPLLIMIIISILIIFLYLCYDIYRSNKK